MNLDIPALLSDWPWTREGQDLDPFPVQPYAWKRVVACLNLWNDVVELKQTLPRWIKAVDHVIAVDGAYQGMHATTPGSDDGTLQYLGKFAKVQLIRAPKFWANQTEKRSIYFREAREGDLLWIVDADEYVVGADALRSVPYLDVGWVTYGSPLYRRPQHTPRLFRWQPDLCYAGRHHWVHLGDRLAASHQAGGPGLVHRLVPLKFYNTRGALRPDSRQFAGEAGRVGQIKKELTIGQKVTAHEPLRITQIGPYDAGMVISRLHTAINTTTPHESAMVTPDHPFQPPAQVHMVRDRALARDLLATADVVHHHVTYVGWDDMDVNLRGKWAVMHHHGTEYRRRPDHYNQLDAVRANLRVVSNLELLQYSSGLRFLPNPVPVAQYRRLWEQTHRPAGKLRIGHSPSKRKIKGTEDFLAVCATLSALVEPVLIEGKTFAESLTLKATCHLFFDSFFLGMQCSGLEAAAMGLPVIAGDETCQKGFQSWLGYVPYTYANDGPGLAAQVERLATDAAYREAEARRVSQYVEQTHDGAVVAQTYLGFLDDAVHWREALRLKAA